MDTEGLSFEQAFEMLQATIQKLEEGGLTLEAGIEQFELGIKLSNRCTNMLDQAELKVSRLLAGEEEAQDGAAFLARESR
jgi:exodeoxyribonuclease VII small subunit